MSLAVLMTLAVLLPAQTTAAAASVECNIVVQPELHDSALARFKEGESALKSSKWPVAENALKKAVAFDPLMAIAHYGLGQSLMEQQRFPEARDAFVTSRDAFRCAPAMTADDRKRREKEIRDLRDALRSVDQQRLKEIAMQWKEANGDMRTAGERMRTVQEMEQRLVEMESALKFADPAPIGVTLALGTALFQTGALPEAEREFRAVLARDPKSGDAHNNLSLVCMLTGRLDEAEREMEAAKKAGISVNPRLGQEIERRRREATPPMF